MKLERGHPMPSEHLCKTLQKITEKSMVSRIGYDGSTMPLNKKEALQKALESKNISFELVDIGCLVSNLWEEERPPVPCSKVWLHKTSDAGQSASHKMEDIRKELQTQPFNSGLFLNVLDDIAWLLNLRASDIEYNPLFFSFL